MKSSEFRKAYAGLSEVTTVEANGHVIGTWVPVGKEMALVAAEHLSVSLVKDTPAGRAAGAGHIVGGSIATRPTGPADSTGRRPVERYDQRPLTAVPKPGRRQR